jgi:hypothetical protein
MNTRREVSINYSLSRLLLIRKLKCKSNVSLPHIHLYCVCKNDEQSIERSSKISHLFERIQGN